MAQHIVDQAYDKAVENLLKNGSEVGVMASRPHDFGDKVAYDYLFPRDMGVCVIGMLMSGRDDLRELAKLSLESLVQAQSELGQFPQSYRQKEQRPEWWHAGTIDGTLWWAIAFLKYYEKTGDKGFYEAYADRVERAFTWLRYQDTNNDSLVEQGEAAGWDDEMGRCGTVLYPNALWFWLVSLRVAVEGREDLIPLRDRIKRSINDFLWIQKGDDHVVDYLTENQYVKDNYYGKRIMEWVNSQAVVLPYYLGFVSHLQFEQRFETFGNIMACLTGVADEHRAGLITDFVFRAGVNLPYPVKVLYPPIYPGEPDWRPYMAKGRQNYPWQYHNAGIWPFIGGWWVLWLGANGDPRAESELNRLAEAAAVNDWEFNEYLHGQHGTPMGMVNQSWNMAMYIAAYQSVKHGTRL
jgi:glycogen debranching enzyme